MHKWGARTSPVTKLRLSIPVIITFAAIQMHFASRKDFFDKQQFLLNLVTTNAEKKIQFCTAPFRPFPLTLQEQFTPCFRPVNMIRPDKLIKLTVISDCYSSWIVAERLTCSLTKWCLIGSSTECCPVPGKVNGGTSHTRRFERGSHNNGFYFWSKLYFFCRGLFSLVAWKTTDCLKITFNLLILNVLTNILALKSTGNQHRLDKI